MTHVGMMVIVVVVAHVWGQSTTPPPGTIAEGDAISLIEELSNWGRWGRNDSLGLMNLHNAGTRMNAWKLVQTATPVSLSRPVVFGNNKAAFPMPATRLFIAQGQGTWIAFFLSPRSN